LQRIQNKCADTRKALREVAVPSPTPPLPMPTRISALPAALFLLTGPLFGSVAEALRFDSSDFMRQTTYRDPSQVATDMSPSGAMTAINIKWDQTRTGPWFIEEQRHAAEAVVAGIVQSDPAAIARGLKALRWGYEQQRPDGSFDCPDVYHSTTFVVEAAARACLYLQASAFAGRYAAEVAWLRPRVLLSAEWMVKPQVEKTGRGHDDSMTHRFYLDADALGEAGVLCSDPSLIERSWLYVRQGLARQDPSGFNPERKGYDSSYDAVGLNFAGRYYDLVATPDQQREMLPMFVKGFAWLKSRILPDGSFNLAGSTRVGGVKTEVGRNGAPKGMDYPAALHAIAWWAWVSKDPDYAAAARRIFSAREAAAGHQVNWTQ
jgi:hypothetical protein